MKRDRWTAREDGQLVIGEAVLGHDECLLVSAFWQGMFPHDFLISPRACACVGVCVPGLYSHFLLLLLLKLLLLLLLPAA